MLDLVGTPEDRFSNNEAQFTVRVVQGVQGQRVFVVNIFKSLNIFVPMYDLVHNVETMHCICYLLTASGNLF